MITVKKKVMINDMAFQVIDSILGLVTNERITFRKPFRMTIRSLIGFRDFNYIRSQALQLLSRWRTGPAHCEVMGVFTKELITFQQSFAFTSPQNQAFWWITIQSALFSRLKSLIWKSFEFIKGQVRFSDQERVRIMIRNGFWIVIRSFVNRPIVLYLI